MPKAYAQAPYILHTMVEKLRARKTLVK